MTLHDAEVTVTHVTGRSHPDGRGNSIPETVQIVLERCNVQPVDTTEVNGVGPVTLRLRIATAAGDPHDEISPADEVRIPGRSGVFSVDGDPMTYQHVRGHTEFYVKRTRR